MESPLNPNFWVCLCPALHSMLEPRCGVCETNMVGAPYASQQQVNATLCKLAHSQWRPTHQLVMAQMRGQIKRMVRDQNLHQMAVQVVQPGPHAFYLGFVDAAVLESQ